MERSCLFSEYFWKRERNRDTCTLKHGTCLGITQWTVVKISLPVFFSFTDQRIIRAHSQKYLGTLLLQSRKKHLEQVLWNKIDKTRKVWCLILNAFWLPLPKFNLWKGDWALAIPKPKFEIFLLFPNFLRF